MATKQKTEKIYGILIVILLLAILSVVIFYLAGKKQDEPSAPPVESVLPTEPSVMIQEVEKLIEVEKEITAEVIEDGLRGMGVLLTQEYYFTDVIKSSSVLKLYEKELPWTESSFVATYDGVVTAGIDFTAIRAEKDEEKGELRISLPAAQIETVEIDPESFTLHYEKEGLWNHLSVADYNQSLVELKSSAREKAIERGILTKADENARTMITNYVSGLLDPAAYTVIILTE